jgi:hypothetical protein
MRKVLTAWLVALVLVVGAPLWYVAQAQQPGGAQVGPGGTFGPTVYAIIYPFGITPIAIASLPTCTATQVGGRAILTNGAVSTPGATVSSTGAVYGAIAACSQVSAGPTYGWVYD